MTSRVDSAARLNETRHSRRRRERSRIPPRAADARRSVKNILDWNSYLPVDCVRTMVKMGWDYKT